ncbi:hypothetical protein SDC9_202210 [bioreactor metagenome]|uniref:Uncharacterized protein n=1 Tax=bioreactor metagenome TaxID=1076179 RepID=A0A645IUH4_9ZZZZ
MLPKPQQLRRLCQAALADQRGPQPGQAALGEVRAGSVEVLGHHHAQHRITQKLQPLIAAQSGVPVLIGIRAVGKGVAEQVYVPKRISELFFQ